MDGGAVDRLPSLEPVRIDRRELLRRAGISAGAAAALSLLGPSRAFAAVERTLRPEGLAIARVWPRNARQAVALASFDDTHAFYPDGSMDILLWPGDLTRLKAIGADYKLTVTDLDAWQQGGARSDGLAAQPGERTGYRLLNDFTLDMQSLATQYPGLVRMFEYPLSSLEGRKVYGVEIATNVMEPDGRPIVHIDGTHHAREWPSAELPIMFAHDLCESYGTDARMTNILDKGRVIITPVMNPDGFERSRTGIEQDQFTQLSAYWRKNERSLTDLFYAHGNPDAVGTDPNRNYAWYWGGEPDGGNQDPTSQTYAGSAPYAEPESKNIAGMMKSRQVTAYLTNHTYGRLCMRPWGHTTEPTPDDDFQWELGEEITAVNGYTNQIGLQLYPTAGTSRDWSYAALRTIVYTFEHGTAFHPSYASTIPNMYAINRVPFQLICEAGIDAANHSVITGRLVDAGGAPVQGSVTLSKEFETPVGPEQGAAVPEKIESSIPTRPDGSFEYHANPSTRPIPYQEGAVEAWTVTFSTGEGTTTRRVVVDRGERAELGDVQV